jgi:hypothetical protein
MKSSSFLETLPEGPCEKREDLIVEAVENNHYLPIQWCAVSSSTDKHMAIVYVGNDALKVGTDDDYVRINVSHGGAQRVADSLGVNLPTSKIVDLMHEQASNKITPCMQQDSVKNGTMMSTKAMERHSREVSYKIRDMRIALTSTVGKHWILHNYLLNKKDWGVNYGWHDENAPNTPSYISPGGSRLWQDVGTRHNRWHVDYSQIFVPVNRIVLVNGEEMLLNDVLVDPELSELVSYDGPLKLTRHPQIPVPDWATPTLRF